MPLQPAARLVLLDKPADPAELALPVSAVRILMTQGGNEVFVATLQVNDEGSGFSGESLVSRTLRVFDRHRGSWGVVLRGLPARGDLVISPDGGLVAAVKKSETSRGIHHYLLIWDIRTGRLIERILVEDREVYGGSVAFSADGNTLAYSTNLQQHAALVLWDVPKLRLRSVLEDRAPPLAFSPDSRLLATGTPKCDCHVDVWNVERARQHVLLEAPPFVTEPKFSVVAWDMKCLTFSADGSRLGMIASIAQINRHDGIIRFVSEEKSFENLNLVREWNTDTGKLRDQQYAPSCRIAECSTPLWEGTFFLRPGEEFASLYNPLSGEEQFSASVEGNVDFQLSCAPAVPMYRLTPSADASFVVVSQYCGEPAPSYLRNVLPDHFPQLQSSEPKERTYQRLYDTKTGRLLAFLDDQDFGAFSPDDRTLATISSDRTTVYLWNLPPQTNWLVILGLPAILLFFVVFVSKCRWQRF